jgi:hypothetical protein
MSGTVLEARAVITGEDRTSAAFAAVEAKINHLGKSAAMVDKVARSMSGVSDALASRQMISGLSNFDDKFASTAMIGRLSQFTRAADAARTKVSLLAQTMTGAHRAFQQAAPWLAGAAGYGMMHATLAAVKAGADMQSSRAQMAVAGIPQSEVAAADAQSARLAAAYTNVHRAAILEAYKETRSVLLKPDETPGMMPTIIATKSALDAMDRSGTSSEGLQFAVKGAEVLGRAQDPEQFKRYMDAFVRAREVMGKMVTPEAIYDMSKYFRASGRGLSDRFVTTTGFSLMQELGGSQTGTGVDQLIKQIVGGFQGAQHSAAKEFVALGLANKGDFETTKNGEIKGMKHGKHVAGSALAASSPDLWVWNYVIPALEKAGYKTQQDQIGEVRRLFPNARAADIVAKLITQRPSFENHAKLYGSAHGLNGADELLSEDPFAAANALSTSLANLGGTLPSPLMKDAARSLSGFASQFGAWGAAIDKFDKAHPDLAKWIGGGAIAVGLGGGGLAAYGMLSGLMGGFGLKGSAIALDQSAASLTAAAARLGASSAGAGLKSAAASGGVGAAIIGGLSTGVTAAMAAGLVGLDLAKADAKSGNSLRSMVRGWFGIEDPHEPAPWMSGGAWDENRHFGGLDQSAFAPPPLAPSLNAFPSDWSEKHLAAGKAELGDLKAIVEGPVTAQLEGAINVDIGGRLELSGQAAKWFSLMQTLEAKSSSDNLRLNTGRSMPGAAPFSRRQ